jgi:hypothetical protein
MEIFAADWIFVLKIDVNFEALLLKGCSNQK